MRLLNLKKTLNLTLSEDDFVSRHIEAFCCLLSGLFLRSPTHPVMTIHVLEGQKTKTEEINEEYTELRK